MPRLLFEKTANAIWISHLDLMRVFQRAFKRAGLPLTHSHGFNPRPSVSIALPLSVGVESHCELLDFALDGCDATNDEIRSRLNHALTAGVRVLDVYDETGKIRDLSLLRCEIHLDYDAGISDDGMKSIQALFSGPSLTVPKKTKSGIQDQDIIPMIRRLSVEREGQNSLIIDTLICCQNPALNPGQIVLAVEKYLPELKPDFSRCIRKEIYDINENVFR